MCSGDIIKSNIRQISKSNISKTGAIFENFEKSESFLDFYLVHKYVTRNKLKTSSYKLNAIHNIPEKYYQRRNVRENFYFKVILKSKTLKWVKTSKNFKMMFR